MFSRFCVAVLVMIEVMNACAQNLVPNPDFEIYTACPNYVSQISYAPPWTKPTDGTSDYMNQCAPYLTFVGVPSNQFGDQSARSGMGYAGFYAFYNNQAVAPPVDDGIREYIQAPLTSPLKAGHNYIVECYVSLSDYSKYATDAIGILLSVVPPSRTDKHAIERTPQIKNPAGNFLSDKTGWTKISACFTADSAYRYITIGNFNNGLNTPVIPVSSIYLEHYCYYFVDDVSVRELTEPELGNDTTLCHGVSITLDAGPGADHYIWSTGDTTQMITVDAPAVYWVNKYSECTLRDTVAVNVSTTVLVLGPDTSAAFCYDETILVEAGSPSFQSYEWSTGETTPYLEVKHPGIYILTVTDTNGCAASDEVIVSESCTLSIFIPDAFTPNHDGINDHLQVFANQNVQAEISIYNRWGERLFNTTDLRKAWDGKHKNADCGQDIYICVVKYEDDKRQERLLQQAVLLLR